MVKDIELIESLDVLFEKDIILFGAGIYGYKTLQLLDKCGIRVRCFIDNNEDKINHLMYGYRVISITELQEIEDKDEIAIIVTSIRYIDDIVDELFDLGLKDMNIYSYYALKFALEINIEDDRINAEYRNEFKQNRNIWKRNNYICNIMMPEIFQLNESPDILVYQPSKVGSSTLYVSLREAGINSVQIHTFQPDEEFVSCMSLPGFFKDKRFDFILKDLKFYQEYYQKRKKVTKIITMVREPLARDISEYLTFFYREHILNDRVCVNTYKGVERLLEELSGIGQYGYQFEWFDRELKKFTGIDIFSYPFNKEIGYSIIKQGNMEILIMKMEKINQHEKIIADFIENSNFKIILSNIGKQNPYKYIYSELKKNIKIPKRVVDRYYKDNKRMDYFYAEEEKKKFLQNYKIY